MRSLSGDEVGVERAMSHPATSVLQVETGGEIAKLIDCSESWRDKDENEQWREERER